MSQEKQFDKRGEYAEAERLAREAFADDAAWFGDKMWEDGEMRTFCLLLIKLARETAPSHERVFVVDDGHVGIEAVRKQLESDTHEQAINLEGVTGDEMDKGAERAALLTRLMAAGEPRETMPSATLPNGYQYSGMKAQREVFIVFETQGEADAFADALQAGAKRRADGGNDVR